MLRPLLGSALLLASLVPQAVSADASPSPRQWLERMSQAAHRLDYDGTFVYSHDGHMQTMRIVHSSRGGSERERLLSLSGPSREVIRDNDRVTCILPDDNAVVEESTGPARRLPIDLPSRLETLERYYNFSDAGSERIAGHDTRKILITPLDRYRYGHALWLHQDKGLLLRSELYNEEGRVVEQLMFTALEFHEQLPSGLLEPETRGRDVVWQRAVPQAESHAAAERWAVGQLPPGFVLENHRHHVMAGNAQVEHLLFSDGLASVSVFIEPASESGEGLVGSLRLGAVNTFSRNHHGYSITVMGEVPLLTAQRIAESVSLRD
ncbi:MAG: MucB/RseB C-terminal domain-containing protein [Pseudomonadota bacterium]